MSQLKYFRDYTSFIIIKKKGDGEVKSNNKKASIIKQIHDKGLGIWFSKNEIFLSPHSVCENFRRRNQERKPRTPQIPPDKLLRKLLKIKKRNERD